MSCCVRLDWKTLECFAVIDYSGDCGLFSLITQLPARGERNQTRRGKQEDGGRGLQAVVAINPPEVRSRKRKVAEEEKDRRVSTSGKCRGKHVALGP